MRRHLPAVTLSIISSLGSLAAAAAEPQAGETRPRRVGLQVAQAQPQTPNVGQGAQDERKDDQKKKKKEEGPKAGGKPPGAPGGAPQPHRERGPQPNKPATVKPLNTPQSGGQRSRGEGSQPKEQPRGVQRPLPPAPPAAQGPQLPKGPKRDEHRSRDRDGGGPPQQAQPKLAPTPPAPAGKKEGDGRGGFSEPKKTDRARVSPPVPLPSQQVQPPPPAPGGWRPAAKTPGGAPGGAPGAKGDAPRAAGPAGGGRGAIEEIKRGRREHTEDGGKRTVIEEPGNRTIVQQKGARAMIRHDEGERLNRTSRDVRREGRPDGGSLSIAVRPGGIEVFSEFDRSGRLTRRYRRDRDGREHNLIDNRRFHGGDPVIIGLRPPLLHIPVERYIIDYERASDDDLYDALIDEPVERLERGYSLEEVRYNAYLRDRMRRIDLDTVNFDFGAWQVPEDQYARLERIAVIIKRILDRNPDEVFLIEGHTDAVGSEIDNLTLSDRRAEEVAVILTETFDVPPENLVTQGYGEEFLKVPTPEPERANRRVAVRRITPLLARDR